MFSKSFIRKLLPPFLRKNKQLSWLSILVIGGRNILSDFKVFKVNTDNCIHYNSQTLSLQAFLRIKFNDNLIEIVNRELDTIYISWLNENQQPPLYIGWLSENQQPPLYIGWLSESNQAYDYDFIVRAPIALQGEDFYIKFYTSKLKLATKRFKVVYF
jgi:hypothetical protein